ncbi:hypothetical protein D3C71_1260380 [compost metagenome]
MIPAAAAPMAARATTSIEKLGASAVMALNTAQAAVAPMITRTLPTRSPSGPYTSCSTP